ncbi:hypothetical protein BJX63DRAFT_440444 [Aspergillus granulosus]|uniref:BTB domain-containing protein n=1 Tax=Aspergillus granulosus TaxID=176169 RepID=A0ABR4GVV0_9EURO
MDRPTHVIDPDGEVIIVLRNANTPFAEPSGDIITQEFLTTSPGLNNNIEDAAEDFPTEEPATKESTKESAESTHAEQYDEICFRIQVSAKHVILVSSVFKKMLTGGWKESIAYLQSGSVELIIPRKLSLEMLAKVAVLADYYDCREAVDILADIWIIALDESVPTTYSRDLILWVWVSWFFQLHDQFEKATSTAMSWSSNSIDSMGLPIPDYVIRSMNTRRQGAIADVVVRLDKIRDGFLSGRQGCSFECKSIMYGALTMQMQSNALLSPKPTPPFPNLNYKTLVQGVLSFTSPLWCSSKSRHAKNHNCYHSSFKSLIGGLNDTIKGLDLGSLIHR